MAEGGKPLRCLCSLLHEPVRVVKDFAGQDVVICDCPNSICGCRWQGKLDNYYLDHRLRCNFRVVKCYCKQQMFKGYFGHHLTSECKYRIVDYSVPYEFYDLYGLQECLQCKQGCQWYGTCARYEKVHSNQCKYLDILCYCGKYIKKCFFAEHVMSADCELNLNLQPGTSFSEFKPELNTKTVKDKGVQCDIFDQHMCYILENLRSKSKSYLHWYNASLLLE